MTDNRFTDLRQRAREILGGKPVDVGDLSTAEIENLLQELQIHQIELRLQNEELRAAQHELELSRQKYANLYDFAPVGYLTIRHGGMVEEANLTITDLLEIGRDRLLGRPFASHVVPAYKATFFAQQRRLFETHVPQRVELQLRKGDGQLFYAQLDSSIQLPDKGDPTRYHMVVTDIHHRKLIELEEYEQRVFADSLRRVANALNRTPDLDAVLEVILEHVNAVVQHDVAEVLLFEGDFATVVGSKGYTEHELEQTIKLMRLPIARTPNLATMVETGKPMIIADIQSQPRWIDAIRHKKLRAYVGAPIQLEGRVIGCLNVFNERSNSFVGKHAERLQAFADQAATAIKNAQLFQQAQQVAALQERQRLARDLHDAVSQALFSSSLIAEALPRLVEKKPAALKENLDRLLLLTKGAMAEMRALLLELRADNLERYSLPELLHQLVEALRGRKRMTVNLQSSEDVSNLPLHVKEMFYRVAQEAMNNVIKHSNATDVWLRLDNTPDQLTINVRDNGRGFDPNQQSPGFGLFSMRERAQSINAELSIESEFGQGTSVTLIWDKVS